MRVNRIAVRTSRLTEGTVEGPSSDRATNQNESRAEEPVDRLLQGGQVPETQPVREEHKSHAIREGRDPHKHKVGRERTSERDQKLTAKPVALEGHPDDEYDAPDRQRLLTVAQSIKYRHHGRASLRTAADRIGPGGWPNAQRFPRPGPRPTPGVRSRATRWPFRTGHRWRQWTFGVA
jgi:hypothetical protein